MSDSNFDEHARRMIQFQVRQEQIGSAFLSGLMTVIAVAWLYPWMGWAAHTAGHASDVPLMPPLLMIAIVVCSAVITRAALKRSPTWKRLAAIVTLSGLSALIVVAWIVFRDGTVIDYLRGVVTWTGFFSPQVVVVIITAMLWLRGVFIGRADVLREDLESMFYTGTFALFVLLVFDSTRPTVPLIDVFWSALIFFASSLLALALVGPEHAHFWQRETSSVRLMLNRYWLMTVGALIGLLVLIGLALAGSARTEFLTALRTIVTGAITLLAYGVQFLMGVIVQVLVWLLTPLAPLFERLGPALDEVLRSLRPPDLGQPGTALTAADAVWRSPDVTAFMRGLIVLVIVMLFVLFFVLVLIRLGFLPKRRLDETRESIASRDLLLSQLQNLFKRRHRSSTAPPPYLALNGDEPRVIVRRAYQVFLDWAKAIGQARSPEQTPLRVAASLSQARPAKRDAIMTLTETYTRARYGLEPITSDDARAATDSLVSLQTADMIQSSSADQ